MKGPGRQLVAAAAAASILHGGALAWLAMLPAPAPMRLRPPPARVRLAARPAPTPPPEPRPELPQPPPAPEPPRPKAPRVARADPTLPRGAPPPPPRDPAPAPPAAPRRFAVALEATVPAGGVAVPTTEGPTAARGRADLPASAPVGDNSRPPAETSGTGPAEAVDVVEVERAPRKLREPSPEDLRALYPEQARKDSAEADVRLQLLVDEAGRVAQVRLVQAPGGGFEEAAGRAARLLRFEPARRGGRPVPVWIPWTLKFRLEG